MFSFWGLFDKQCYSILKICLDLWYVRIHFNLDLFLKNPDPFFFKKSKLCFGSIYQDFVLSFQMTDSTLYDFFDKL